MADLPLKDEPLPPSLLSRKQRRKLEKKEKRRLIRQAAANEARLEAERLLRDPVRLQEEAEALEEERIEREIQEKLWLEREQKAQEDAAKKREEEERRRKEEEEEWIYVDDDGPSEIIWEGNEIIVRKKKVRVRRSEYQERTVSVKDGSIQDDRPVSNPLAPTNIFHNHECGVLNSLPSQATTFEEQKKLVRSNPLASIEQTPNFGTEQDKTHCPFHIKTGVCRFGVSCSRVHVYPDKSCTLLIKNMYNGPGLPLDHDEGLEYTEEEIEQYYEEFYEDVHEEFLKYGELVSFKVCRNESSHLRGNVYVQFQSVDSAVEAYNGMNGRFYAGKQITCEFVVLTRWRAALCGEYMRSRHRVCSHGTACNFLHCFRNPRGEYEWADWDNHLPKPMKTAHGRRCDLEYTDQRSKYRYHTDRYASRSGRKRSSDHSVDRHISRKRRHADDHSETSSYENCMLKESEGSEKDRQRRHDKRGTRYKDARSDNDSREGESRIERRHHKSYHRRKESRRYSKERSIESDGMKSTYKDRNRGNEKHYPKMSPVGDVGSTDDTKQRCRGEKRKRRHRSKSTSSEDSLMDVMESMRKERRHHHHGSKRQGEHRKHDKVSTRKRNRTKNMHEDNNDSDGRTPLKEKMQHETEKDWNHHIVDRYEPSCGSMD